MYNGYQYKLDIAGVEYGMHDIQSCTIEQPLFDKLGIGGTCSAKLETIIWPIEEIPRAAEIKAYIQIDDIWEVMGTFITSQRWDVDEALKIIAYDYMLKSEQDWKPADSDEFPMSQRKAAEKIAALMGMELDPRCELSDIYQVTDYPVDTSMRDVLQYIAISHAGNWIVTRENKLLLIPLFKGVPPETWYLVEEGGGPIIFGDYAISVKPPGVR